MPKEVCEDHDWLYDTDDLPLNLRRAAVVLALRIIRERVGRTIENPAIGLDDRTPGVLVCMGITNQGPFRFNIPLNELDEVKQNGGPLGAKCP